MEIRFKDTNKMKKYLEQETGEFVSVSDLRNCLDYLKEYAEYIIDCRKGKLLVREKASLEIDVADTDCEVWVTFDSVAINDKVIMIIDFDYD